MSRRRASTGPAAASRRSSPAAAESSARRGPEHEPALHVAGHEPVVLERDGEPVGGRAGEAGAGDQAGERGGPGLEGGEHEGGLVEDADSARVVHMAILPSQIMGCKRTLCDRSRTMQRRDDATEWREQSWAGPWRRRSGTSTSSAAAEGEPDLLYIDLHLIHEVTSPAGVRRAAPRRSHGTPPRPDPGDRGPQRPDARLGQADRRPGVADAGRDPAHATPRSSASACTRSATSSRASCTSSARSSA